MLFHASPIPELKVLTPHASNHGRPLVYFSRLKEYTLPYLSNAVEKYCKEQGFLHQGSYHTWASYGFTSAGVLELWEYYPGATADTYQGVSGYIYLVKETADCHPLPDIPYAVTSDQPLPVTGCEYIPDAYQALINAARQGHILLRRYEQNGPQELNWIQETITAEYQKSQDHPEYQAFLKAKFPFLI